MGTSGLIGYVHKGQNYVRYKSSDSYPEGLGVKIRAAIPSNPDEFLRWLEEKRALLERIKKEVTEKSNPFPRKLSRTTRPIILERDLEWIYVLNLDRLSFSVNDKIHFRLDNLPPADDWLGYIAVDGSYVKCIAPWTPEQYRGEFNVHPIRPLSSQEQQGLKWYDDVTSSSTVEKIHPSTWLTPVPQHLVVQEKLALLAAEGFMTARYAYITNAHRYYWDLKVFEDLAKDILTAACHGGSSFTFDGQTARVWSCDILLNPVYDRKRIDYYWFRDRLICLVRPGALELEDHCKAEIGIILEWFNKNQKFSDLTAILWSINHVAVLVISGDKISHSDVIPVAAALSKRKKLEEGLRLIMHYLPLQATNGSDVFYGSLPLEIVLRIMKLCEPDTQAAIGRTAKALRYEWVRFPHFGPYQLLALEEDRFLAADNAGRHVTMRLEPRMCFAFRSRNGENSDSEISDDEGLTAYRKPIYYRNIHGYRVLI